MVLSVVSCKTAEKTSTTTPTTTKPSAVATTPSPSPVTGTSAPAPTTTPAVTGSPPPTSTPATATGQAKWWEKYGKPKYGGVLNYRVASLSPIWDVGDWRGRNVQLQYESIWDHDWTVPPEVHPFRFIFVPVDYQTGRLAKSWEWKDPTNLVVYLREGIRWQNKPPLNGREMTAYDVEFRFDRLLGTGSGYDKPEPMHVGRTGNLEKVTALDKYTVNFKFSRAAAMNIYVLLEPSNQNYIIPPELIKPGEAITDPAKAIGTGPWMITEVVEGSVATYDKNPDYWGYDERWPGNKLPYFDQIKFVCIPDLQTALAALRTAKIDLMDAVTDWRLVEQLGKSNPEIKRIPLPGPGPSISLRVDRSPFNDLRVRKALQMSIDREAIAASFYGGTVKPVPCAIIHPEAKGYNFPYEEWPDSLKEEYRYNIAAARKLLTEAGYPNGFKTNCVASGETSLLEVMKAYFLDIGVDMEIKMYEATAFMQIINQRKHDQMRWDGAGRSGADAPPFMAAKMYAANTAPNENMVNDPVYEDLLKKMENAVTLDELKSAIREADKYAISQHWSITTFPINRYNLYQPNVRGLEERRLPPNPGWQFARMWKE